MTYKSIKLIYMLYTTLCLTSAIKENVILIIPDDLGIDFIKQYEMRESHIPLPIIEEMIDNGILFENAYSYPSCSPTRASILTGRYGFRTGTRCAVQFTIPDDPNGIKLDEWTIPRAANEMNIKNACFGKWHISTPLNGDEYNPNIMGFNEYAGSLIGVLDPGYYNWTKTINGNMIETTNYATIDLRDDAIAWLQENQHDQFFLWLAFDTPHSPFHNPPNELHEYHDLPEYGDLENEVEGALPWYYAMAQSLDTVIGQIINSLDDDVLERTNIILMGDNGEQSAVAPGGPFNETKVKGTLYEGAVRVPLIVMGPRVTNPGTRNRGIVSSVDLFDTILDMLNCTNKRIEKHVSDSISLISALEGITNGTTYRHHRFCEQDTGFCISYEPAMSNLGFTMANEQFKLWIMLDGEERLYDILNDPDEENNLISYLEEESGGLLSDAYHELKSVLYNLLDSEETFTNPLDDVIYAYY